MISLARASNANERRRREGDAGCGCDGGGSKTDGHSIIVTRKSTDLSVLRAFSGALAKLAASASRGSLGRPWPRARPASKSRQAGCEAAQQQRQVWRASEKKEGPRQEGAAASERAAGGPLAAGRQGESAGGAASALRGEGEVTSASRALARPASRERLFRAAPCPARQASGSPAK